MPQADAMAIAEPELRELYAFWQSRRSLTHLPARADIELEDLDDLLSLVMLVEVLEEGRFFRFELIGSDLTVGVNPVGKLQHEELPDGIYRDHITALFRRGAAGPGALYSRSAYSYADVEGPRAISRLFLPLASDGTTIDNMLIGQMSDSKVAEGHSAWEANPPSITEVVELRLP
jgi:PAS domain